MIENILPYICHAIFLLLHLHKTHLLTQERRTRGRDKIKQKPSLHSPHCFKNFQNNIAPYPCKGNSRRSWIPDSRYWMPVSGTRILGSNRWWDSGFLEGYRVFQKPRIPDSTSRIFNYSRFQKQDSRT